MSAEAKCNCQRCGEHIAFPVEMTGQEITCPHCGRETTLLSPQVRKANPDSNASVPRDESKSETPDATKVLFGIIGLVVIVIPLVLIAHQQSVQREAAKNLEDALTPPKLKYTELVARSNAVEEAKEENNRWLAHLNQEQIDQSNSEAEFQTWRSNYLKTGKP